VKKYDVIIVGSGPAGLGAAFHLIQNSKKKILLIEKDSISSGGLRNDCKQNYLFPVGFPLEYWNKKQADNELADVEKILKPKYQKQDNLHIYLKRAKKLDTDLLLIKQYHVGTDKAKLLINNLIGELKEKVEIKLNHKLTDIDYKNKKVTIQNEEFQFKNLILAPGRKGSNWLQNVMDDLKISYVDNKVDIGIRLEMREENYNIVKDYYDPKFLFPDEVRTFCTNSGAAFVVKEKYEKYFSVNGHSFSTNKKSNGLVNFAMLKTIYLTDPVVSGQKFAEILGRAAMQLSGGKPMMQRMGDFRIGRRSKENTFNEDLYNFKPTLNSATPGDVSLAIPSKIMRALWQSMKKLDAIVPGVLHPSTIIYYPEIKTYANKPTFIDEHFQVCQNLYMIGDGAGTSRGITAAWASGIRAAKGMLK